MLSEKFSAVADASMTVAFDDRPKRSVAGSAAARTSNIGTWLAKQWPKAALALGLTMIIIWGGLLLWSLTFIIYLF
jgi:hypothetical protein